MGRTGRIGALALFIVTTIASCTTVVVDGNPLETAQPGADHDAEPSAGDDSQAASDATGDGGSGDLGGEDAGNDAGAVGDADSGHPDDAVSGGDGGAGDAGDSDAHDSGEGDGSDAGHAPEKCGNGDDDDGDGDADCADSDCWANPACFEDCGNGKDDDVDGKTDCGDSDCLAVCTEDCGNGKDDDGDGKADCGDSDCLAFCTEVCGNGKDDDGDGKTDCGDSDCSASPACVEKCDDGVDNDVDGLVDCDDDDCDEAVAICGSGATAETCNDMYVCLIEQGCGCKVGVNCPADSGACLQSCYGNPSCNNSCLASMTVDTQKAFNAWQGCLAAKCQGALTDAAFQACFVSKCLSEYGSCFFLCDPDDDPWNQAAEKKALIECTTTQCAGLATEQALSSCYESECIEASTECFYAGDATCYEGFFGCYVNCPQGDQKCGNACLDSLSPEGAYDLFSWQDCRLAACDSNGDLAADSIDCWAASYLACADIIGSCTNKGWPGEATCAETTACAIACGGFGPSTQDCIGACIGELSPDGLAVTSAVWSCAIDACGTTGSALTSACVQAALKGQCAPEASACGIALP